MRKILMWIVWNIKLGRFAPFVFGLAIGRKGIPVIEKVKGE